MLRREIRDIDEVQVFKYVGTNYIDKNNCINNDHERLPREREREVTERTRASAREHLYEMLVLCTSAV